MKLKYLMLGFFLLLSVAALALKLDPNDSGFNLKKFIVRDSKGELISVLHKFNDTILGDGTMNPYRFPEIEEWECWGSDNPKTGYNQCMADKKRMKCQVSGRNKNSCSEDWRK
jgi:hypothetical protein